MSKTNYDIIHSPEAETFLHMVTKGFYDRSYIGLWLYEVIGREWDEMAAWAGGMKTEIHPQTCTWSIAIWEWVYGIESDNALPLEHRRQRILAKIIGVRPINPEVIRRGVTALISGLNAKVEVNDFVGPYRFDVVLHLAGEAPLNNYAKISSYIRKIKPAHLAYNLRGKYPSKFYIDIKLLSSVRFISEFYPRKNWPFLQYDGTAFYNSVYQYNGYRVSRITDLYPVKLILQTEKKVTPTYDITLTIGYHLTRYDGTYRYDGTRRYDSAIIQEGL